jgi:NADH:ubiquinone oxidoreductase subunit 4 (subunit M)
MGNHQLSTLLCLPLLGIIVQLFIKKEKLTIVKNVTAVVIGLQLWLTFQIMSLFDKSTPMLQFVDNYSWINAFAINFIIGLDGINLPFLMLTTLILFGTILLTWHSNSLPKTFYVLLLFFDIGLIGLFCAFDLFLLLSFLGILFFSTFFLLTLFSTNTNRDSAFLFGIVAVGSFCLLLIGTLIITTRSSPLTFNLLNLVQGLKLPANLQTIGFFIFLVGFLLILPVFPFHFWFTPTILESTLPINILLMTLFTKVGIYGVLRLVIPLFPKASIQLGIIIGILAIISILYFALCSFSYQTYKVKISYINGYYTSNILLSISVVILINHNQIAAVFSGLSGAMALIAAYGLTIPLLILLPEIRPLNSGGEVASKSHVAQKKWTISLIFMLIIIAGIGIPGFFGFAGQYISYLGLFQAIPTRILAIIAFTGQLLITIVFFQIIRDRVLQKNQIQYEAIDHTISNHYIVIGVLLIVLLLMGIFPAAYLAIPAQSIQHFIELLGTI